MIRKSRYPRMNVAKLFDPNKIKPSIVELPDPVVDKMLARDKAFWVDKPGVNDYTIHDAYYTYGMATEMVKQPRQDPFPRSYQYDLDCVQYRRRNRPLDLKGNSSQQDKRWRYYPDVTAKRSVEETRKLMNEGHLNSTLADAESQQTMEVIPEPIGRVGRPFYNEVCNWYYDKYPSKTYECIVRKFSK